MDQTRFIAKHVVNLPKSGIRDFFEVVARMKDVISLGIGEPDFDTPNTSSICPSPASVTRLSVSDEHTYAE